MRRGMLFAAVAMVAVGCSTAQSPPIAMEPQPPGLVGPRGPVGPAGPAGAAGYTGATGSAGAVSMGLRGPDGPSGPTGAQGATGVQGGSAMGAVGVVDRWTSYREFMFDYDRSDVQAADSSKINEIAAYMNQNPSLQVGIDGSMDPRGSDPRDQN